MLDHLITSRVAALCGGCASACNPCHLIEVSLAKTEFYCPGCCTVCKPRVVEHGWKKEPETISGKQDDLFE